MYGALSLAPALGEALPNEALTAMDRRLAARGPDGAGLWPGADAAPSPVALGHRRLAILDPTPRGDQPMVSADGRRVIVYNGEIYNFRALRRELEEDGVTFRTTTDTEVLLALHARHGAAMLDRLRGMYAFALWDDERRELLLARDPLGIKPLYYAVAAGRLYFASQVRALEAVPAVSSVPDPAGVAGFLLWGSVPEPFTLRREIRAVHAGHHLTIPAGHTGPLPTAVPHGAPRERYDAVPEALEASVRAHLVSDVPVAVFLSAGLDSTLVAALATRHLAEPPVTFTLAVEGAEGNEAPAAARVAAALGTRHVERRVAKSDLDGYWEDVLEVMDQPSIDGFNTFVVSRLAHEEGIKVALSGLGGDELLGGYPSFDDVPRLHAWARRFDRLPGARRLLPALARRLAPGRPKIAGILPHGLSFPGAYFLRRGLFLPEELPALLGADLARQGLLALGQMAATCPAGQMAATCPRDLHDPAGQVAAICRPPAGIELDPADPWRSVHRMETARYLRNQLLRDADWAGMASSVEIRVPLVDETLRRALVEDPSSPLLAHGAPGRDAKRSIVRAAAPELPAEIFERPKQGFYVPVGGGPPEDGDGGGDDLPAAGRRRGLDSRALALRLLRERGLS